MSSSSMKAYSAIFSQMCLAARQAGVVALAFQGKVANDGKIVAAVTTEESELVKVQREAKTQIGELVQEIILLSLREVVDPKKILLDAEEDTPLARLFGKGRGTMSLVIDPIDGTLEYLQGRNDYAVCIGIVDRGRMKLALVFFPAQDVAYAIAPDGKSYRYDRFAVEGTKKARVITLPKRAQKVVYKNSRVPEAAVNACSQSGYQVIDDLEGELFCPNSILKALDRSSQAYIAHTRQMRDVLLGAIIGNARGGFMSDWQGKELRWPEKGRVPQAMFGNKNYKKEISRLLGKSGVEN